MKETKWWFELPSGKKITKLIEIDFNVYNDDPVSSLILVCDGELPPKYFNENIIDDADKLTSKEKMELCMFMMIKYRDLSKAFINKIAKEGV